MTWWLWLLRSAGVVGVIAAIADPGCPRPGRPGLVAEVVGDLPADIRTSELRRLQAAMPWADVALSSVSDGPSSRDERLVVGDAAPVLAALRQRPALAAIAVANPSLTIEAISAPTRVLEGSRVEIDVHVGEIPSRDARRVRVRLNDAATGVEQGIGESAAGKSSPEGVLRLSVPWLATGVGPHRLRVIAEIDGSPPMRPSPPADVTIQVDSARFSIEVIEARPTWSARFVRLALGSSGEASVASRVRPAPGLVVRTTPATSRDERKEPAQVLIVGGVDALAAADVADIERHVRDTGRVAILLLDEAPGDGPWRRLWPDDIGRVHTAASPRDVSVAGVRWRTREWLVPATSTAARPLAYLDKESEPVVVARSVGAGRVVLVTALDAWRWRADREVEWARGWQALVRRLAADVPALVLTTTWLTGSGRDRVLQLEVRVRPDLAAAGPVTVGAAIAGPRRVDALDLRRVEANRWRGALRVLATAPHRVTTMVRTDRGVVGRSEAVVDVSAPAPMAGWNDVVGHQRRRGMFAVPSQARVPRLTAAPDAEWQAALEDVRQALVSANGPPWYVTRTWWYAALVLVALGSEWIARRVRRLA